MKGDEIVLNTLVLSKCKAFKRIFRVLCEKGAKKGKASHVIRGFIGNQNLKERKL